MRAALSNPSVSRVDVVVENPFRPGSPGVSGPALKVPFSISIDNQDGAVIAKIAGELDMATSAIVQENLRSLAGQGTQLVFDLEDVSFIDSSAMALFIAPELRERVRIRHPSPSVRRLLQLLELDSLIED